MRSSSSSPPPMKMDTAAIVKVAIHERIRVGNARTMFMLIYLIGWSKGREFCPLRIIG